MSNYLILILSFITYTVIVVTASGSLRRPSEGKGDAGCLNLQSVAWGFALLSTFALPWSGVPLIEYFGAGSWTWFLFAGISLCILKNDVSEQCIFRRLIAITNIVIIVIGIYIFGSKNGIPGDIPGIEVIGAVTTLGGFFSKELILAYSCFLISAIASFLPVYTCSERAPVLLSFSYSSFLAIAFLPQAHVFFFGIRPDIAIIIDAAAYFSYGWLIHTFIMNSFSHLAASHWRRSYVILNMLLTVVGIILLFSV